MLLWGCVGLLLLAAAAVNGDDKVDESHRYSCKHIILNGTNPICQGLYELYQINPPHTYYYRKLEIQSGLYWKAPKVLNYVTHTFSNVENAQCHDEKETLEYNVPYTCAGANHLGILDTQQDMTDGQCNYFTLTNSETDEQILWGFYEESADQREYKQRVDAWGGVPSDGISLRKRLSDSQVMYLDAYVNGPSVGDRIRLRRQKCLGGHRMVYTDVEEQQKSDYHYNCWVIQVTGTGACGTGTWKRYLDDNHDRMKYRRWNPVRQEESDTYFLNSPFGDNIELAASQWTCDTKPLDSSDVKCIGASALWYADRPWPHRYAEWVKQSRGYTGESYGECKMFRMLKAYGRFKQGYYMQTGADTEYYNDEAGVVLRVVDGEWAAKNDCEWEGNIISCKGHYKSQMTPNHRRWTCVSAATYCPYITVTSEDTAAGICQGRYRLWRNKRLSRFDQELINIKQRVIDRVTMKGPGSDPVVVSLFVTGANADELLVDCITHDEFKLSFKIPRSRCFTHGTFHWNKVDYDPPFTVT